MKAAVQSDLLQHQCQKGTSCCSSSSVLVVCMPFTTAQPTWLGLQVKVQLRELQLWAAYSTVYSSASLLLCVA